MSALTVERPRSLVEDQFAVPVLAIAPGDHVAAPVVDAAAGEPTPSEARETDPPTLGTASSLSSFTVADAGLTSTVPTAPAPTPRVRLLAARAPGAAAVAHGQAAQVPPTLTERIAVLRATDRSPVLEAVDEDRGPEPAADPAHVARAIAHAVVEVLLGRRPVTQLARWMTPGVYETLQGRAALTARVLGPRNSGRGAAVRRVRVCAVEPHVCEAGVVVDDGVRVRAVALRLETHRGTWRTTSLEVG
ncbi:Rv3235 family protein [Cellulomonas sp. PhB150]|uniref:Rv3235 family protein n=1 Tax=Cellulomonas sp. PhB150 TaxID=2485188 RepID=UPI000F4753E9|nr:Rv3235 family protein [Cellulomonas sp. PhB150]ROS31176.1 hypothetical protein EDF34_0831 [Cellulomonas sp. PhB150]